MDLTLCEPSKNGLTSFQKEMERLRDRFLGRNKFEGLNTEDRPASADISETKDEPVDEDELPVTKAKGLTRAC
jgi:hypothetical protein